MSELELTGQVRRGDTGDTVKHIQEWLCLDGFGVQIDSDFGPATEAAVRAFQSAKGFTVDGIVAGDTFAALVAPMRNALQPIAPAGRGLGEMVVAYANQHLQQSPREVGGDNCGPWVRLYMSGHDGIDWRWCAGFACFCLKQASDALGVALPVSPSFSCDSLATSAKQASLLLDGDTGDIATRVTPGCFFLVRRPTGDWSHTGIVTVPQAQSYGTIEGNSNDGGSPNGYEVVGRTRGYAGRDFIMIG